LTERWTLSEPSGIPITVTQPDDPAYALLQDGYTSTPTVFKEGCYICEDPEFAQMGLPLCKPCPICGAHVAADDIECDNGHDTMEYYYEQTTHVDDRSRTTPHGDPMR
jgi:hypothetical protein